MVAITLEPQVFDADDLAKILGISAQAVRAYASRKNWDQVPPPARFGGLNKWTRKQLADWLEEKEATTRRAVDAEPVTVNTPTRGRGRPRKADSRRWSEAKRPHPVAPSDKVFQTTADATAPEAAEPDYQPPRL